MSSGSWTHVVESSASPAGLFKATVVDWHNIAPKVLPDIIASATPVEGVGGVGSIRQINFTPALPFAYVKERLDFIDHDKLEVKSSLVEGGDIGTKLEFATSHFKYEPSSNGGTIVKVEGTYKALPGVTETDEITKVKEGITGTIKAAEAYLAANPTYV